MLFRVAVGFSPLYIQSFVLKVFTTDTLRLIQLSMYDCKFSHSLASLK
nr:MAG TPA: hypothetical protein [Caudoviricetes sp.]